MLIRLKKVFKSLLKWSMVCFGIALSLVLISCAYISATRQTATYEIVHPKKEHHAIIKILHEDGGSCSAFVISDNTAFTAGHCIKVSKAFMKYEYPKRFEESDKLLDLWERQIDEIKDSCSAPMPCERFIAELESLISTELAAREEAKKLKVDKFKVVNSKGEDTGVIATSRYKEDRQDFGVINGDFKQFQKLPVTRGFDIKVGDVLRSCGFPGGTNPALCIDFIAAGQRGFEYAGQSMLVPGMSGGPIIDAKGVAVGVNSAVRGTVSIMIPTLGQFDEK